MTAAVSYPIIPAILSIISPILRIILPEAHLPFFLGIITASSTAPAAMPTPRPAIKLLPHIFSASFPLYFKVIFHSGRHISRGKIILFFNRP